MFKWLRRKAAPLNSVLTQLLDLQGGTWTKRGYMNYAREAYEKNVIAFHCISSISESAADIPYIVKINGKEQEAGKINQLLKRPHPTMSYKEFMHLAIMYRLISGNCYMLGNRVYTGRIMDLQLLRPDRVRIDVTTYNEPVAYVYELNGKEKRYQIEAGTYSSDVLHIKSPNPTCDLYGLSPLSSAIMAVDQHNESGAWNKKLLENSARPPGVLTLKDKNDGAASLTDKQKADLRDEINEKFAGYRNAGKIPILTFDMEWRSMGMSPTDMDWLNGKNSTARDICLAFRYPPHLLGLPEGATFNNMGEAKLALYEEAVIPMLQSMLENLSTYLTMNMNQEIEIVPDLDQIPALTPRREILRRNAREDVTAGLITINEARLEIGYDEVEGGDDILVPAGKLPLNFDTSNLTQSEYKSWLMQQGFESSFAKKMAELAYEQNRS